LIKGVRRISQEVIVRWIQHVLIVGMILIPVLVSGQSPDVYWGLDWTMSNAAVDSALHEVAVEKKNATKTLYDEARQIRGYSYRIAQKGIEKLYVWYHEEGNQPVQIHSIEVVYRFEYPYDAQRFKQAYFEKYGRSFEAQPAAFQSAEGVTVYLRIVEEPDAGKLGNSVYLVSLLNPAEYESSEESSDFIY